MADYKKLVGTTNPSENWTSEFILARDEETGEVTKSVVLGVPVDVSADDRKLVESLGGVFEDSSAEEFHAYNKGAEQVQPVGEDTAHASPALSGVATQPSGSGVDQGSGPVKTNKS